ncbi:MAG: 1,4-alpha-glucan branching enzyme, partial [Kineothrix sp.]|nr:1,4-alpha-glucan branching enzyme [Kineothrix sp.]
MAAAKKNVKAPKKTSVESSSKPKPDRKQAVEQIQEGKVFISEADEYLFAQGTHYDIYKKLGAHPSVENGVEGMFFGVWAPNAASVHVIGTFNGWDETLHKMKKLGPGGMPALFIP